MMTIELYLTVSIARILFLVNFQMYFAQTLSVWANSKQGLSQLIQLNFGGEHSLHIPTYIVIRL